MTPKSFDLESDSPTATVAAACTKNRREAIQPLPLDVAKALAGFLRDKSPDVPVWPGKWKSKGIPHDPGRFAERPETMAY
jgi:hypothetical protein